MAASPSTYRLKDVVLAHGEEETEYVFLMHLATCYSSYVRIEISGCYIFTLLFVFLSRLSTVQMRQRICGILNAHL
jgi:hypothetical protein